MAGIHCCFRRLLVLNTSRLTDRNGVLLQITRKRHHLVFQISSLQKRMSLQKPKLMLNANKLLLYRLASTNVTDLKEPVSDLKFKITEVKHESDQLKKQSTELNNETYEFYKEPEVVKSSSVGDIDESSLPPIPTPPSEVPPVDYVSMGLPEPPLQSLGLGSWWPTGIIQQMLEYLHIHLNLPWWESILIFTVGLRMMLFPLYVKNIINNTKLVNSMPQIAEFQQKISEAKLKQDYFSMSLHTVEFQKFLKTNNVNPFGVFKLTLIQAPVFIFMYNALKDMAAAPVESFKTGGLAWFKDFTVADPYYILNVILAGTLLIIVEIGAEVPEARFQKNTIRWLLRGFPVVVFLFSLNFISCVTWFWTVSNTLSLCQTFLFKIPVVKKFFKIPDKNLRVADDMKKNKKGIIEGFKEGIENAKIMKVIEERDRMNYLAFKNAGKGPVPRTFKNNPFSENNKKSS